MMRTADGIEIVVGMVVYSRDGLPMTVRALSDHVQAMFSSHIQSTVWCELSLLRGMIHVAFSSLYSTRLAALTARAAELSAELARANGEISRETLHRCIGSRGDCTGGPKIDTSARPVDGGDMSPTPWRPEIGERVEKSGGDYEFTGTIVARFAKLGGAVRLVVENRDGLLFIFNEAQLRRVEPCQPAPALPGD